MSSEYLRDSAMSALILGFFASCWFGWAQENPPARWRTPLIAGAIGSVLIAMTGGVLAWRHWSHMSALDQPGAMARFGIVVGIEVGLAALGAGILVLAGRSASMAPWICLVVGAHFWPLAPLLKDPSLYLLGTVLVVIAIGTLLTTRRTSVIPSAIVGACAGSALLVTAGGAALMALF